MADEQTNAAQITYWNSGAAETWVDLQEGLDRGLGRFGEEAIERARIRAGEHILDVGCGCGQTSLQLAERVGSSGRVLGVDLSAAMLSRARQRADEAGLTQVRFEQADAQVYAFEENAFDLLFSRFGVMFFEDPTAAFANLLRAIRPGGRLVFVCWQGAVQNVFMSLPVRAVADLIDLPPRPPADAPGPLAFADADRVQSLLERAGWKDVAYECWQRDMLLGGGSPELEASVEWAMKIGPLARVLKDVFGEAGPEGVDLGPIRARLREEFTPYLTPDGVCLPCGPALVTARQG